MADKDFKVKNKLVLNGLAQAGILLADANKQVDSVSYLTPLQGGTGTTQAPSAGQVLYSTSGTTYAPVTLSTLVPQEVYYQASAPSSPATGAIWVESDVDIPSFQLPSQTGNSGKYLTTDGNNTSWSSVSQVPSQIGNSGKFLTTDGTNSSWANVPGIPSGTVIYVAQNTAPAGYLKANGATISRTTYADLFTAIGTTFGAGDGSTTFVIPDLRSKFIRSWSDNNSGTNGYIDTSRTFGSTQLPSGINQDGTTNAILDAVLNSENGATFLAVSATYTSGSTISKIQRFFRPYNIALLACIKY